MVLLKSKPRNRYELPFKFIPNKPTLDEILKGRIVDAQKVIKSNNEKRKEYYNGTRGFVKKGFMKHIGSVPIDVLFNPELKKYFAPGMDAHERKKERNKFYKKYPQFAVNGL